MTTVFRPTVYVTQGEFRIGTSEEDILVTTLGSCVATCLCDPVAKVGGMNHFLLPQDVGNGEGNLRYGAHAMELLINGLLKKGAQRHRLRAKLFGGASMIERLGRIGASNAEFAVEFLRTEGIVCEGQSLGGTLARKLRYWPATGRAQQLFVDAADPIAERELRPAAAPAPAAAPDDDVEFF